MSVKFQEETVRTVTQAAGGKPEDLVHRIGDRLTGGKGQTGYLQVCSLQNLRSSNAPTDPKNVDRRPT